MDFDPPDSHWNDASLELYVDQAEDRTSKYATAVNEHIVARETYERALHIACEGMIAEAKSEAQLERMSEACCLEERIKADRMKDLREVAMKRRDLALSVLSAKQSDMRAVAAQT